MSMPAAGRKRPMHLAEVEAKFHLMAQNPARARRAAIWAMRDRLQDPDSRFAELLTCSSTLFPPRTVHA
jgi:hypothetical protein